MKIRLLFAVLFCFSFQSYTAKCSLPSENAEIPLNTGSLVKVEGAERHAPLLHSHSIERRYKDASGHWQSLDRLDSFSEDLDGPPQSTLEQRKDELTAVPLQEEPAKNKCAECVIL